MAAGGGVGVSAKCQVMGIYLKLSTSKKRGGGCPFWAQLKFSKTRRGGYLGFAQVCICPFFGHAEGNLGVSCFKSDGSLHAYLMLLLHIPDLAGTLRSEGLAYNNGGLRSTSSLMQRWLTTPPTGGGQGRFLFSAAQHQRGCLTGYPILVDVRFVTFRVSHHRFMVCPLSQCGRFESFRVSDHRFMGCLIPQCGRFESFRVSRGAQSRNFGCAHNKYIICHAMVVCCCVSCGTACTSHPKKKTP